ncbi:minor tail protein [Arthrobacter phage Galaxy]|uniref:Minor tail protein n=1 Tax=Arthrobacter phage Galaxy TaxID=1772326 RepID=A0A0U4B2C6_9CAUD|nr:minor tail protein [Arthrobacter phage Galaxy]ALY08864.1 minor tail protein [Arthrobacter phage Galaxy]
MWTLWLCETMTGAKLAPIQVQANSWARVLNGRGSGSTVVNLLDALVADLNADIGLRNLTRLVSTTLVVERAGRPIYAGVLWSREYDRGAGTLTLSHSDVRSIFMARKALAGGGLDWPITRTKLSFAGLSLGTIAKRLVEAGMAGPNAALPIVLPGDMPGIHAREYFGYNLPVVEELLDNLTNVEGGPDLDFEPRWSERDTLEWVLRTGTDSAPELGGGPWDWNLDAEQPGVSSVKVKEDAAKMGNRWWEVGEGEELDMLMARATANPMPAGFPLLERDNSHKTTNIQATLDDSARADLATYGQPTVQWSLTVAAGGVPAVEELHLGGLVRVHSLGDPWLADGWHSLRLIEFSGDVGESVTLAFQPERGAA